MTAPLAMRGAVGRSEIFRSGPSWRAYREGLRPRQSSIGAVGAGAQWPGGHPEPQVVHCAHRMKGDPGAVAPDRAAHA
jgi:hypothetical protein